MTAPVDNYFEQGMALMESGDHAKAVALFTKALRLSLGDMAETYLYRGICYAFLEAYDRALEDFNEALRYNPYLPDAYNERGNLMRLKEDYERAIRDYDAAITIDSAHYAAYYNRALTYEQRGDYAEAERDLTQTIELNPGIASAYEMRGRIRAMMQDYHGAIDDLQRYLRMGGGREFDNHSEVQSFIISLRFNQFLSKFLPRRFLLGNQM